MALNVLVVEDNPTSADLLKTRLKNLGCTALVAATAEEAFELALAEGPAFALLDLKLDDDVRSGLDLLHKLRADARTADLPVFIHSIFMARQGDVPEAEAMANGYLLKPFKFEDLRQIVNGFLAARDGRA
jgi:two-component system phosphate regulon response regulator PhoB